MRFTVDTLTDLNAFTQYTEGIRPFPVFQTAHHINVILYTN